jgi:hypothetical protein
MKKFSTLDTEVKPKYELKDSLRNEIYSLIENTILLKFSSDKSVDADIDIHGKDELVEKIKGLVDDVRIKERILTLEKVKQNVHRNFDMKWLNEQIDNLKKFKVGSEFVLLEKIQDARVENQYKASVLSYFSKKLFEDKKIGEFEFEYEPSDGIFKFIDEADGIVVKATPFYNTSTGFPIEVFDEDQSDSHIFIEERDFNIEELLYRKYREIMEKFLIDDFDNLIKKVNKFDEQTGVEDVIPEPLTGYSGAIDGEGSPGNIGPGDDERSQLYKQ